MAVSDWNPIGHKDDFHKGRNIVERLHHSDEAKFSSSSCLGQFCRSIYAWAAVVKKPRKKQADLKANPIFVSNLVTDPKQVRSPLRALCQPYEIGGGFPL